MSITASEDLVYGQKIRQTKDGYWANRAIFLEGLDPTTPPGLVLGGTYNGSSSGSVVIPQWADEHPTLVGAFCIEVEQHPWPPESRTSLRVVASYGPGDLVNAWKITVSGSNGTKELSIDASGNPLFVVKYPNPDPGSGTGSSGNANLIYYGTSQYLEPGSIVTFEHDEYESPWSKVTAFKSCTNTASFLGFSAHAVLCRDIELESCVSGTRWHVRYIFEILPGPLGWQQAFVFEDPYTGKVPSDVSGTDGSMGILIADPYEKLSLTGDFNTLGLPTGLLTD